MTNFIDDIELSVRASSGLMVRCVNAHDRCAGSAPCPWCEPVVPLRREDGRFTSADTLLAARETKENDR